MDRLTPSNANTSYSYADDLDIVDDLGYDDIDDGYIGMLSNHPLYHQQVYVIRLIFSLQMLRKPIRIAKLTYESCSCQKNNMSKHYNC